MCVSVCVSVLYVIIVICVCYDVTIYTSRLPRKLYKSTKMKVHQLETSRISCFPVVKITGKKKQFPKFNFIFFDSSSEMKTPQNGTPAFCPSFVYRYRDRR